MRCKDSSLQKEFHEANMRVLEEIDAVPWASWRTTWLPRSHGNFAVGEEAFRRSWMCEEDMDTPVKDILARCYSDLDAGRGGDPRSREADRPAQTPEECASRCKDNHPGEGRACCRR